MIFAFFIGFGINTFYSSPKAPVMPERLNTLNNMNKTQTPTNVQIEVQNQYDKSIERFNNDKMNPYQRNVSIISLAASVILLALSMFLERRNISVISDGVMLGGLFMLLYSIGRGVASQDSKYMFVAVTIGLIVALYLGYHRFVVSKPAPKTNKKSKK